MGPLSPYRPQKALLPRAVFGYAEESISLGTDGNITGRKSLAGEVGDKFLVCREMVQAKGKVGIVFTRSVSA